MEVVYLVVGSESSSISVVAGDKELDVVLGGLSSYRVSPIFPVHAAASLPKSATFKVTIFVLANAFRDIGQIGQLGADFHPKLWFSIGLSSLVVFDLSDHEFDTIKYHFEDNIRAYEIWTVEEGQIRSSIPHLCAPVAYEPSHFHVNRDINGLDGDTSHLLDELRHGLNSLVPLVAQYCPELFTLCRRITDQVNEYASGIGEYFSTLNSADPSSEAPTLEKTQKQLNTATDKLIQLNSVLSYAISQTFGGTVPLLSKASLIHSHSLLGVGTATLALYAVAQSVDAAFVKTPVYSVVKQAFQFTTPINPFRHLGEVDLDLWSDTQARIDEQIEKLQLPPEEPRPHVMFFSGRLGFQEAPNSISAANQSIFAADSVRWSLMTLTHEIMHAHVRDLLSAVLGEFGAGPSPSDAFVQAYSSYSRFLKRNEKPQTLLESVRHSIFNYCRFRRLCDQWARTAADESFNKDKMPTAEVLYSLLQHHFRDINEIIVHSLDFRYFYDANPELYTDYLWSSWATVPSVLADPEHYVLRTIAAISTNLRGGLTARFEGAVELIRSRITELRCFSPRNVLLANVEAMLTKDNYRLRTRSLPNQYLAEITVHCLYSSRVSSDLLDDELLDEDSDGQSIYLLDEGEFPGEPIKSPIALLVDRIRRLRSRGQDAASLPRDSGWLFLAVASALE